jgi:hypothetical protein
MNEQKLFLDEMYEKISSGEYDKEMTIPFMTKNLIYAAVKAKVNKKIEIGGTPILTKSEIKDALRDARETAVTVASVFIKNGILDKTEDGYDLSEVMKKHFKFRNPT